MKTLCWLFTLYFTLTVHLSGQEIVVQNSYTGVPVENVAVFNQDKSKSTLTNAEGKASLSQFESTDSIYFQHTAYDITVLAKSNILNNDCRILLKRKNILIDDIVISFNKLGEDKRDIPHMVDVITAGKTENDPSQTSADILTGTGNIIVQKSQGGGGSPILRGFEANKILLVVDGVRMNNAIYRSGHLQNSITIDNNILERIEIIYGPSSIIYGSDALGGVIHYYTRDPVLSGESGKPLFKTRLYTQYSSANEGKVLHFNFNTGLAKFGSLTSITFSDYGDIKMGMLRAPFLHNDYGKNLNYTVNVEGKDSTVKNSNPEVQLNSGYSQYDILQKFKYSPNSMLDIIINFQYSTSSYIPRYDQLNLYKGDDLKFAEWQYGPQNRFLASLKSTLKYSTPFFTNFNSILSFQRIDEDRITRYFGDKNEIHQEEDLYLCSVNFDLLKLHNQNTKTHYGIEFIYNNLSSSAFRRNITDNTVADTLTRYPDKGNQAYDFSAYIKNKWNVSKKYILSGGIRFSYSYYDSEFDYNSSFYNLAFSEIVQNNAALTLSLGLIYLPVKDIKLNLIFSSGYRNPNIDDYGKIREKSGTLMIPDNNLKPEYSYNGELGFSGTFDGYIQLNGALFLSYIRDAITRTTAELNGTSLYVAGEDTLRLIKNYNAEEAVICGTSLNIISDLNSDISFKATFNYTYGKNLTDTLPLSHIPPIYGITSVSYQLKKITNEIYVIYNGWKRMKDLNPYGEDNIEFATGNGFPGWFTLNARTTWKIDRQLSFMFAVENILDYFYMPFASGIAAPGRNFMISVRMKL